MCCCARRGSSPFTVARSSRAEVLRSSAALAIVPEADNTPTVLFLERGNHRLDRIPSEKVHQLPAVLTE